MLAQPDETNLADVLLVAMMNLGYSRDSLKGAVSQFEACVEDIPEGPVKAKQQEVLKELVAVHARFLENLAETRDLLKNERERVIALSTRPGDLR